jgi:hypothetical protein
MLKWGSKFRIIYKTLKIFSDFSRENRGNGGHEHGVRRGVFEGKLSFKNMSAGGRLCNFQENPHFWVPTIKVRPPDGTQGWMSLQTTVTQSVHDGHIFAQEITRTNHGPHKELTIRQVGHGNGESVHKLQATQFLLAPAPHTTRMFDGSTSRTSPGKKSNVSNVVRPLPIDYRREDGRFPVCTSCVTISKPDWLPNSETGVNPETRSW